MLLNNQIPHACHLWIIRNRGHHYITMSNFTKIHSACISIPMCVLSCMFAVDWPWWSHWLGADTTIAGQVGCGLKDDIAGRVWTTRVCPRNPACQRAWTRAPIWCHAAWCAIFHAGVSAYRGTSVAQWPSVQRFRPGRSLHYGRRNISPWGRSCCTAPRISRASCVF